MRLTYFLYFFICILESLPVYVYGQSQTATHFEFAESGLIAVQIQQGLALPNPQVALPLPDGQLAQFVLHKNDLLPADLAKRFPAICSYSGHRQGAPHEQIRLERHGSEFRAMIWLGDSTVLIEPQVTKQAYRSFYRHSKAATPQMPGWTCLAQGNRQSTKSVRPFGSYSRSNHSVRILRVAIATTGEYTQFHGGTKTQALFSIVTALNRLNAIFERDLSVRMQLVSNNDQIIYTQAHNDPYTNGQPYQIIAQNQTNLDAVIGNANYDLGHVFAKGGGGIAYIGSVGQSGYKALGASGIDQPIGDPFVLDYVAHEMGHQLGAHHTHNNPCGRNLSTAFEPGSGSTLMAYPGICPPIIQMNADAYFHGASIQEIRHFVFQGQGQQAGFDQPTQNKAPVISAIPSHIYIPVQTPFKLSAQASDPDGDSLSYCWEQFDRGVSGSFLHPSGNAPLFRSLPPNGQPVRIFPRLTHLLYQSILPGERLPGYDRSLRMRLTVRDNHPGGGAVSHKGLTLTATSQAGPFQVLSPNQQMDWWAGSFQEILWDVAHTDQAPIHCKKVSILLSADGGYTYPYTLAENISNSGRAVVKLPPTLTGNSFRVMVKAADHIFFDVSNENFRISNPSSPGYSLLPFSTEAQVCSPDTLEVSLGFARILGYQGPISLTVVGLPPGTQTLVSPIASQQADTISLRLIFNQTQLTGTFPLQILSTSPDGQMTHHDFSLALEGQTPGEIQLLQPPNGAHIATTQPTLRWKGVEVVDRYQLELATHPSFAPNYLLADHQVDTDSFVLAQQLAAGRVYYWRLSELANCRPGARTRTGSFRTYDQGCTSYQSFDVPKAIPIHGAPDTIYSYLQIKDTFPISDLNVSALVGQHTWVNDLEVSLRHPNGREVLLFTSICGDSVAGFDLRFDDESAIRTIPCPPMGAPWVQPASALAAFDELSPAGSWTLIIKDLVDLDGGKLTDWGLEVCASQAPLPAPHMSSLEPLSMLRGERKAINRRHLSAKVNGVEAGSLLYTLVSIPVHGQLKLAGKVLKVGDTFRQQDIFDEALSYQHLATHLKPDGFDFTVEGSVGSWLGGQHFRLEPDGLTSLPHLAKNADWTVFPNPARDAVSLRYTGATLPGKVQYQLLNPQGQILQAAMLPFDSPHGQAQIPLRHLAAGLYLLSIQHQEGFFQTPILIVP